MVRKASGEIIAKNNIPMEGRDNTPVEYVPYRRFEEHVLKEERHWASVRRVVAFGVGLSAIILVLLFVIIALLALG